MKNKIIYIWDYYKFRIVFSLLGIFFLISCIVRIIHPHKTDLYIGFVNVSIGTDLRNALIQNSDMEIKTYENLLLSDTPTPENSSYIIASQTKILATINAEQLDIVILDENSFGAFAQNGYLIDIDKYFDTNCPELKDKLKDYYVKNIDLSDENHPQEYIAGIDLSSNTLIKNAEFSGKVYLGIIKNTKRYDNINEFLSNTYSSNNE